MNLSLPLFHRVHGTKIVLLGQGEMLEARRRIIENAGAIPCSEAEAHHARLGFIAGLDERQARAAAQRLRAKGILVNVTDRPELCDFTMPALVERAPVQIAIGTGGASAGLAKHLRLRLEALLPPKVGLLASGLNHARAQLRKLYPDASVRRQAIDRALQEGGALDPMAADSHIKLDEWLAREASPGHSARICHVVYSHDPDDLTLRQARDLGMADIVYFEQGIADAVCARARADAVRIRIAGGENPPLDTGPGVTVILRCAPQNAGS